MSEKRAVYDSKVRNIIELLRCKTREEVAKELGYKNHKSMDAYLRRRNFRYDNIKNTYVAIYKTKETLEDDPKSYAPSKVINIITAFESEVPDPMLIAKQEGFKDHKEMAEYMTKKGYEWSFNKNNYVKRLGKIEEIMTEDIMEETEVGDLREDIELGEDIDQYIPFIRFLYEKRDEVYKILSGANEEGKIPRYAVPGVVRTKAIYMSSMVANLTSEFSKEKNLTQREVIEGALIEFLQKYGFKKEIDTLLNNQ